MNSISNQLTKTSNSQKDFFQIPNNINNIFISRKTLWDPDPYLSDLVGVLNIQKPLHHFQ